MTWLGRLGRAMLQHGGELRAWFYGLAWLGGGIAALGTAIWLVVLIRWGWPAGTEARRLDILGQALLGTLAMAGLVALGLTMRNAIRQLKGTAGLFNFEANGPPETPAKAAAEVADAAQTKAADIAARTEETDNAG